MRNTIISHCNRKNKRYSKLGDTMKTKHGALTYIDNGANILAVGHRDVVMRRKPIASGGKIIAPQLDDRLGLALLLDILPQRLGRKAYDVLITDSEEAGNSTAQYFVSPKQYNWVFELDRAGEDVVMYEYETDEYCELIEQAGASVGVGSFTDICYLESLGVAGFNWGCGYHNQHTDRCYVGLKECRRTIERFVKFFHANKNTVMPDNAVRYDYQSDDWDYRSDNWNPPQLWQDLPQPDDDCRCEYCGKCLAPHEIDDMYCESCHTIQWGLANAH